MDTRLSSRREDALVHAPSSLARSALVCSISCPPAPAGLLALSMWGEVQLSLECRGSMAWRPPARARGRCVAPHGARGGWRLDEGGRQGAEGADREGGGRSRRAKGTHDPAHAGCRAELELARAPTATLELQLTAHAGLGGGAGGPWRPELQCRGHGAVLLWICGAARQHVRRPPSPWRGSGAAGPVGLPLLCAAAARGVGQHQQ